MRRRLATHDIDTIIAGLTFDGCVFNKTFGLQPTGTKDTQ
jgi:hypothetical protein